MRVIHKVYEGRRLWQSRAADFCGFAMLHLQTRHNEAALRLAASVE
jgi:hypothetical protein